VKFNYNDGEADIDPDDDPTEGRFKYIASKSVLDSDGFHTDYTWYFDKEEGKHVFVFGDNEIYFPEDEDYDWEVDGDDERAQEEAQEWFDSYDGIFDESEFDESLKEGRARDRFDVIDTGYEDSLRPWKEQKKEIIKRYQDKGYSDVAVARWKTDAKGLRNYAVYG